MQHSKAFYMYCLPKNVQILNLMKTYVLTILFIDPVVILSFVRMLLLLFLLLLLDMEINSTEKKCEKLRNSGVDFIKVGRTAQIIEIALLKLGAWRKALHASKKILKSSAQGAKQL